MTEHMDTRFEVASFGLRVPASGGYRGTAAPALRGRDAIGAGFAPALRQRLGALVPNPPVSGLLPVRRQVLTS